MSNKTSKTLYRMVRNAEDWAKIMGRDLDGWYTDIDCTKPATREEADSAGDDIYADYGWNVEPCRYPVLAHTGTMIGDNLTNDEIASLADDHESSSYESDGEAAYGRED